VVIPHPADIAEAMRRGEMATQTDELKKLITIASDLKLAAELRTKAIELVGNIGTHDALLTLLEIAANEKLVPKERDLALKYAREVIKAGH